jgi:hypothetical protein
MSIHIILLQILNFFQTQTKQPILIELPFTACKTRTTNTLQHPSQSPFPVMFELPFEPLYLRIEDGCEKHFVNSIENLSDRRFELVSHFTMNIPSVFR